MFPINKIKGFAKRKARQRVLRWLGVVSAGGGSRSPEREIPPYPAWLSLSHLFNLTFVIVRVLGYVTFSRTMSGLGEGIEEAKRVGRF